MKTLLKKKDCRKGTTTVEFAMTVPLVFLLFFGAIDFSRFNMLSHSIDNAAYEGARRGIVPGATTDEVRAEVERLLAIVGARSATIEIQPDEIRSDTQNITVSVSLPMNLNAYLAPRFLEGKTVAASCTLVTESSKL